MLCVKRVIILAVTGILSLSASSGWTYIPDVGLDAENIAIMISVIAAILSPV